MTDGYLSLTDRDRDEMLAAIGRPVFRRVPTEELNETVEGLIVAWLDARAPGESFRYTSGCPLDTPDGFKVGISNGNRKNRRTTPANGKTSAPAPFATLPDWAKRAISVTPLWAKRKKASLDGSEIWPSQTTTHWLQTGRKL